MRPEVDCTALFNTACFVTCTVSCWVHPNSFICFADLRQELAVRERASDSTRMSAPSSPTLDTDKMDTAVQASLSLPATPVGKTIDHPFMNQKGIQRISFPSQFFTCTGCNSTHYLFLYYLEISVVYLFVCIFVLI